MAPTTATLVITDCSRGVSDWFPARLADDQLAQAWNVEFWDGTVAGRRNGCVTRVIMGTIFGAPNGLAVHTPTRESADDRLAAAFYIPGFDRFHLYDHSWGVQDLGNIDAMTPQFGVDWASLHGKLFIACHNNANRLHVWDGTVLRRTGLSAPPPPASVTNAGTGTFADTRQYRLRVSAALTGGAGLRSEPSAAVTFVPSGTGSAARVTFPAYTPEAFPAAGGTLSWEVEELALNESWYLVVRVPMPTPSADDTYALAQVPINGVLSADIGDYALQHSAVFLTVDEDRLLLGGSWVDLTLSARVCWTPLGSAVGVGNDERLPFDTQAFIDFDTLDGGGLTGLKAWEGKVIVFKRRQVHQMVRSSSRQRAYLSDCLSRRHGALPYSIVEGTDVDGLSCLYFLDPDVGPMQLGVRGLRVLAPQLQRTWTERVNFTAEQVASVTYHPEKRQVWWHLALDGAIQPNVRWMYSVETDGSVFHTLAGLVVRGAASWNGKPALLHNNGTPVESLVIGSGDIQGVMTDYDAEFRAYVTTKAYQVGGLMRRFQVTSGVVEAEAMAGGELAVTCVRDFGLERRTVTCRLTPTAAETHVTVPLDDCYLSEALTMQFEVGDPIDPVADPHSHTSAWQIHGLVFSYTLGSPSTGRG